MLKKNIKNNHTPRRLGDMEVDWILSHISNTLESAEHIALNNLFLIQLGVEKHLERVLQGVHNKPWPVFTKIAQESA